MIRVHKYARLDDLRPLSKKWNEALQASGDNRIFSTWEWISRWWEYLGSSREMRVLIAEVDDQILGIAPIMLSKYSFAGFRLRRLEFIGGSQSDYNSFILRNDEQECCNALLEHLMKDSDWDSMKFINLPDGPSLRMLRKATLA